MKDLLFPEDYTSEIKMLRKIDAAQPYELSLRYAMILGCCLGLAALIGDAVLLLGGFIYVTTNLAYVAAVLSVRSPVPPGKFFAIFGLCVVSSLSFTVIAVYVGLVQDGDFLLVSFAAIAAMALYYLRRHNRLSLVAIFDVVSVIGALVVITLARAFDSETWIEYCVILSASVTLGGYYCHIFVETLRSRMELQRRIDMDIAQSRLQAIANLTAGVAHDFNNLLTVIRGNMELAEVLTDPDERSGAMSEAKAACDRAAHLVTQLMAFARKSRMQPQLLRLSSFLLEWRAMASRLLPATLEIDLDVPVKARVFADATLLEAALLNVAINTRDALAGRQGVLSVRVEDLPAKGPGPERFVRIVLNDTGPGAAPEVLSAMTEPFFTTKPVGQGTGLGLSMIKGFVEQAGGTLHIENLRRGGLSVALHLPVDPLPQAEANKSPLAGVSANGSPA